MPTPTRTNAYEAMFLISQGVAADLNAVVAHIKSIIEKAGGQIIAMRKWDERRLAYEIDKQKRGLYLLTYFTAPAQALTQIERSCNLSEQIMRQLILKVEHMTLDQMQAADGQRELEVEAKLRATSPAPVSVTSAPEEPEEEEDDDLL